MSGRIRTIKPEVLEDATSANLSDEAWRLWVSCWLLADDYGNLRAEPAQVQGAVFWAMQDGLQKVSRGSLELVQKGLLRVYEVRGQRYAHISGWSTHQKVNHRGQPRCPGPETAGATVVSSEEMGNSREPLETVQKPSGDSPETLYLDQDQDQDQDHDANESGGDLPEGEAPSRGTRVRPDWQPLPALVTWCRGQGLTDRQIESERQGFVDYWVGVSGKAGVKLDWPATFRNRIRTGIEKGRIRPESTATGHGLATGKHTAVTSDGSVITNTSGMSDAEFKRQLGLDV